VMRRLTCSGAKAAGARHGVGCIYSWGLTCNNATGEWCQRIFMPVQSVVAQSSDHSCIKHDIPPHIWQHAVRTLGPACATPTHSNRTTRNHSSASTCLLLRESSIENLPRVPRRRRGHRCRALAETATVPRNTCDQVDQFSCLARVNGQMRHEVCLSEGPMFSILC
jgi:hypothetical protein